MGASGKAERDDEKARPSENNPTAERLRDTVRSNLNL
jgi:hypothetical protein